MYLNRMREHRAFMATIREAKLKMGPVLVPDMINAHIPDQDILMMPDCKTVGCQAGWCFVHTASLEQFKEYQEDPDSVNMLNYTEAHLGLSPYEVMALCHMDWPEEILGWKSKGYAHDRAQFDELPDETRKAKMLAVLDHIIEKGFDWMPTWARTPILEVAPGDRPA